MEGGLGSWGLVDVRGVWLWKVVSEWGCRVRVEVRDEGSDADGYVYHWTDVSGVESRVQGVGCRV